MQLYYFETFNSRKPCAVARYLNSPVTFKRVDLLRGEHKAPDYLAINPNGKTPALVDGNIRLWESPAIMVYLSQKARSNLWPDDSGEQTDVIRWINWDTAHFSRHAGILYFEHVIKPAFGLGEPDKAAVDSAKEYYRQAAGVLDEYLHDRDYLVGNRLTVADFAVAGALPDAAQAELPLDGFDRVARWHARLESLPAWLEPYPVPSDTSAGPA